MLHSVDLDLLKQLRTKVAERKEDIIRGLTTGAGISDYAEYKKRVGEFKALTEMEDWGQDINDRLMSNDKGKAA